MVAKDSTTLCTEHNFYSFVFRNVLGGFDSTYTMYVLTEMETKTMEQVYKYGEKFKVEGIARTAIN